MVGYMVPMTRDNHLIGNAGHMTPPDVADAADISIRSLMSSGKCGWRWVEAVHGDVYLYIRGLTTVPCS